MCPDEAKSTRRRPSHAAGPPYPALLGLENGSWFPDMACSAIIGDEFGSHLGNVGEYRRIGGVVFRLAFYSVRSYALALGALVVARANYPAANSVEYNTFRDLIPLIIAIPAAWLAYSFQRRQSYLKDVRALYSHMVSATQDAIQYTHLQKPSQMDFGRVHKSLSATIEEIRAVFLNLGQTEERVGLFPFEGMKTIVAIMNKLGFGEDLSPDARKSARYEIMKEWKEVRKHFLSECARGIPINPHSPFLK